MVDKVRAVIEKYEMFPRGVPVVAAVSGGSDSMAMLHILNLIREEYGFTLCAAHVNHGLRGESADRDQRFVEEKCREAGVEVRVLRADVASLARERGEGLEECGRKTRYEFFNSIEKNAIIATAHNLDDAIETFIFNFTRGSALRGLRSIPAKRENVVRPLISCAKAEILDYCARNSIDYVTDETNADVAYSRNRIRFNVLPELYKINPSFELCAGRCMESLSEDEDFLSSLASEVVSEAEIGAGFKAEIISGSPAPLANRAIVKICEAKVGITPDRGAVKRIRDILGSAGAVQINGGITARVRKGVLDFPERLGAPEGFDLAAGVRRFGAALVEINIINAEEINSLQNVSKRGLEYFIDCDKIHGKAVVRSRKAGDKITLKNRGGAKTLKKLFNELAAPPEKRSLAVIVADDDGVLLVEGAGCDARAAIDEKTAKAAAIKIIRERDIYRI